jgi:AraC-like DNA-binding protein
MKIYVKNMFCNHCKAVVKAELIKLGVEVISVDFCEAEIKGDISKEHWNLLDIALRKSGLELIDDIKSALSEKIKTSIIDLTRYSDEMLKINLSEYLIEKLHHNYTYLSNIFSEINGMTIEKYLISQKIERVKELLIIDELNLSEIAFKLHYSSLAHLSKQFKDATGMTPTHYKEIRKNSTPAPANP